MSMTWPFHVAYTDPALAATLLAAASAGSLPHMSYPPVPTSTLPATAHLAPSATSYSSAAAAAAAYYRYSGYHSTNPVAALHRPHVRPVNSPYPPPPHLLHSHTPIPSLHILGMPNIAGPAFPSVSNPPPPTVSYRPTLLEDLSPVNSDTSSECDCGAVTTNQMTRLQSPSHHSTQQLPHPHSHHSHHAHRVNAPVTPTLVSQRDRLGSGEQSQQVRLNGMSVPIVTVLPFENNASTSYNHVIPSTSGISSSSSPSSLNKPEQEQEQEQQSQSQQQRSQHLQQPQPPQPKLFQPYKNDTPEDKPDQNGTM